MPAGYLATTGLTILASQHNPPLEDIAAGLTARLMRSGVAPMTGPLWLADGVEATPGLSFNSAKTTGLFKSTLGMGVSVGGSQVMDFGSSATFKDGGDIASANALTLGTGNVFNITGTTAVTSIGTKGIGTICWLRFDGILTLTHHATDLILTTGTNITTAAGDWATFEEYASGDWRMISYARANGSPLKPAFAPPASFKNLSIKVASNTTVTVAADFVTTTDGTFYQTTAVSSTINLGSNVAVDALDIGTIAIDSWYYIWVIAKADGTTKCVASLQSTANATFLSNLAAIASGAYTYYARIGAVQTVHSVAQLYGTWQLGRRATYVLGLAQTGTSTYPSIGSGSTSSAMTLVSLARFVPSTASVLHFNLFTPSSSTASIAANNQASFDAGGCIMSDNNGSNATRHAGGLPLEQIGCYYGSSSASANFFAIGWDDNI